MKGHARVIKKIYRTIEPPKEHGRCPRTNNSYLVSPRIGKTLTSKLLDVCSAATTQDKFDPSSLNVILGYYCTQCGTKMIRGVYEPRASGENS